MPAGRKKTIVPGQEPTESPKFGVTGYGIVLSEEGQPDIEGNFITDEDLAEYMQLKKDKVKGGDVSIDANELHQMQNIVKEFNEMIGNGKWVTNAEFARLTDIDFSFTESINKGQFVTNDEAAHYASLKANAQAETEKKEAEQAKALQAVEAAKQAAIMKLGPNPVHAKNVDGVRTTTFPRTAWDNLNWETKDGKETNVKSGGWFVKAEVPDEVTQLLSNA